MTEKFMSQKKGGEFIKLNMDLSINSWTEKGILYSIMCLKVGTAVTHTIITKVKETELEELKFDCFMKYIHLEKLKLGFKSTFRFFR